MPAALLLGPPVTVAPVGRGLTAAEGQRITTAQGHKNEVNPRTVPDIHWF
ncbi:Hypothetical protein SMAX5B_009061 [Scophthalmus maximus]|uniref:Uncharacterized protein n=1 Tax=Scophthalmus maximus TaxID=52904 RepID=A0A2U9CJB3_SCOMX|nr:Hypothetical protein SMAX5B_009061 [Scophthalmus maximus]